VIEMARRTALALAIAGMCLAVGMQTATAQPAGLTPAGNPIAVDLYPAPEQYRMGGFPPGMLPESFMAGRGAMVVTPIGGGRTKITFAFEGLIPNGVYTLWNVLSPMPDFRDEPLGPTGYGKHGIIADQNGEAEAVVYLDKRPGVMFLLDYHSDGKLTGEKGETVFPGALWGYFPEL